MLHVLSVFLFRFQEQRASRLLILCLLSWLQHSDMVVDSSTSTWFLSNYSTNLKLFTRIQRFIQIKLAGNCCVSLQQFDKDTNNIIVLDQQDAQSETEITKSQETEMETQIQETSFVLQRSVKQLHFGSWEDKETAAKEIIRLAKEDMKTRKSLAALGVIPSLVSMLDSEIFDRQRLAVQALIQLADGTYTNKALMVEAGILSKMPGNVDTIDKSTRHDFALLALSISSLANSQFPIPCTSEVLPFLVGVLDSDADIESKKACLGAIQNLSSMLENVSPLVSNGLVHTLLKLTSQKQASDKALAILGNLVVTVMGKKAIENDSMSPENLIEVMTWEEKPKCQELAAYILMILAHQSYAQRAKMKQLRIVPVLLEVALLGSPLAQKRALKILQWFKYERHTKIGSHSGPQTRRIAIDSSMDERETSEGKRVIKKMVKQSLDNNMEVIMRRAHGSIDSSKLKGLIISSSSKSLPY